IAVRLPSRSVTVLKGGFLMSEEWAERQRHTNYLARRLASHVFADKGVNSRQIYGLSRLGWITGGSKTNTYINNIKIPALGDIVAGLG
ncbi:MAG: hypothetical protein VBE63_30510, partial [Lamprobacter sp.]|uniref:hypothetical protein n=1 Tax=Lamprobacter sp. TaxID=3100796 RepID=UPI002B2610B1